MTPFRDRPIRQKLLLATLASSVTALILAGGGFLVWEITQFRSEIERDTNAQARIVADGSAAAVAFQDERTAGETLAALQLRPQITLGCIYTIQGRLFATYRRDPNARCPPSPPSTATFGWSTLDTLAPVQLAGQTQGTLYVERELTDVRDRLLVGGTAIGALLLLAGVAAALAASRIHRSIVLPLQQLADTARRLSAGHDYSLRAQPGYGDEIGTVIATFNEMIGRITDALARERESNRVKDEFLAVVSHELRTPLNAVLGWAHILNSGSLAAQTRQKALESLERNAKAQAQLVEDLLDVSRITSGKLRMKSDPVSLNAIVAGAVDTIRLAAAARGITIRIAIDPRADIIVTGDADRLQQVVWNLLSNAVKFNVDDGEVEIALRQNNAAAELIVRDSGLGIPAGFLPHLFERFRQADSSFSRKHGGLGLGLAIVRHLTEAHGGTVDAQSTGEGHGATFTVRLPIREVLTGSETKPVDTAQRDVVKLTGLETLVVDDEPDARELLRVALEARGAQVTTASSAGEALYVMKQRRFDLLLADIAMPDQDGYALIEAVRGGSREQNALIPAIAVTAYASLEERERALDAGYNFHVAKPVDLDDLISLIAAAAGASPEESRRS
jgi:signal transduction histidine kinase/ActR/RegA family two-component response regulator